MTKRRGMLFDINSALNKPTTKFGIDYRLLGICLLYPSQCFSSLLKFLPACCFR
jgi:hypothetical protein